MAYPTNPSYIRRVVKSIEACDAVRVSPLNEISIKRGGKWTPYGTTKDVLFALEAEHKQKYGKDANQLLANISSGIHEDA